MQSQAAQLALAVQAQKGTGATTGYTAAITTLSRLVPEFRYVGYENEHGIGNKRSTTHKSQRDKAGLNYRLRAEGGAYPEILGVYLTGLGLRRRQVYETVHARVHQSVQRRQAIDRAAQHRRCRRCTRACVTCA